MMEKPSSGTSAGKSQPDELLGYIRCPFHDDGNPSYAIYGDHAYCYGCGRHESADAYAQRTGVRLADTTIERRNLGAGRGNGQAPKNGKLDTRINYWHNTLVAGPRASRIAWFRERGFSDYQIERFRYGHTGDHFVIPILEGNQAIGYKWRADPKYCDPESLRYKNPWGQPTLVHRPGHSTGNIVVCEGEIDANIVASLGYDAITTTSGAGSVSHVVLSLRASGHIREAVYVATDPDDAGEKAVRDLAEALPRDPLRIVWDGGGDISDYLLRFEAIERHKVMRELMQNARPYTFEAGW